MLKMVRILYAIDGEDICACEDRSKTLYRVFHDEAGMHKFELSCETCGTRLVLPTGHNCSDIEDGDALEPVLEHMSRKALERLAVRLDEFLGAS